MQTILIALNGIESIANGKEYHVLISQSQESLEKETKELLNFSGKCVDGLLVSLSSETDDLRHFSELLGRNIPVVFIDRVTENIQTHKILVDDIEGSYQLTTHLLNQGFKRIAHLTSSLQLSTTTRRLEGYHKALQDNNILPDETYNKYCMHGGMDSTEINTAIEELLSLPTPPDAITTASDRITIKTFAFLKNKGIQIPAKIAMGGFSNSNEAILFSPSLTTVVQPAFEVGKKAIEMLLQLIESKQPVKEFSTVVLPTELIIRDSSQWELSIQSESS
ncbi:MAG TPA: substrate-binding domain-containing protein [Phnomibacter sp.]|nr:substrate-binding domain-containing protein [Phnomibacter sp.]